MKRILILGIFELFTVGCNPATTVKNFEDDTDLAIVRGLTFVKDERLNPPVCFGSTWRGGMNGGPALTTIPCESIPPDMLLRIKKK